MIAPDRATVLQILLATCLVASDAAATPAPQRPGDTSGSATAVLAHATQKVLAHHAVPPGTDGAPLQLMAARNEYEPFLVVLSGLQTVSAVTCKLEAAGRLLPTMVYRVGYISVVNITDCQSLAGPGDYPDPLIPDVDSFAHEKRNAFPLTVPAGENRQVLVDLFVPPETPPGSYTGTVTVEVGLDADIARTELGFRLRVQNFSLPSTSSMESEYGITSRQILAGHKMCQPGALCPANSSEAKQRFDLYTKYLDFGLMHRFSSASQLSDPRWTVPTLDGNGTWPVVPAWSDSETFDRAYGSFVNKTGRSLPFGMRGARLTGVRLTCNSTPPAHGSSLPRGCPSWRTCVDAAGHPTSVGCIDGQGHIVNGSWLQASDEWKGRVTAFWRELYHNFSRYDDGREKLLYDYTFDEPTGHDCPYNRQLDHSNCSSNFDYIRERAAAVHAASPSLRTAVTTELCDPANSGCAPPIGMDTAKTDITLWIPTVSYVAGVPRNDTACGLPKGSQREQYDFATAGGRGDRGLWWYGLSGGGGGGPQRNCTAEEQRKEAASCGGVPGPSWMIDHPATRNRIGQWATFLYDMHGELTWAIAAGFANPGPQDPGYNGTDGWDQQYLGGANGEGTLLYPGRPDKIGGQTHIPVGSLRLLMIREGQEDYEWLAAAARVVGRDRVVELMAPVITSASNFTTDPAVIWDTREKLAQLAAGAG